MNIQDKITSLDQLLSATVTPVHSDTSTVRYYYWRGERFGSLPRHVAYVESSTEETVGVRLRSRESCPAEMWWAVRELLRCETGAYPEPTSVIAWVTQNAGSCGLPALHFLHISSEDPNLVAFTMDADSGAQDKQVRMTLGRYLKKYLPGIKDAQVQALEAMHRADLSGEFILRSYDEITAAYQEASGSGAGGCMSHVTERYQSGKHHPTEVYQVPGMGVAMLRNATGVSARCLVYQNPEDPTDKRMIRVYGDSMLERRLARAGYVYKALYGVKLKLLPMSGAQVVMPYIDGLKGRQDDHTTYAIRRPDCIEMVTRTEAATYTQLMRLAGHTDFDQVASTCKNTGGFASIPVVPYDVGSYVCALTGVKTDAAKFPPMYYVASADAEVQNVSPASVAGMVPVRLRTAALAWVAGCCPADTPMFEHCGQMYIDTDAIRRATGFQRLDATLYPDRQEWVGRNNTSEVHRITAEGVPGEVVVIDHLDIARVIDGTQLRVIHKCDLLPAWPRVADLNGVKLHALPSAAVVLTDTKRKVVLGVHDVVKLADGSIVYERNTAQVSVFGHRLTVRKSDAAGAFGMVKLPEDHGAVRFHVNTTDRRALERRAKYMYSSYMDGNLAEQGTGTALVRGYTADGEQAAFVEVLIALGVNCTVQQVMDRWPATSPAVAAYAAAAAHNLALIDRAAKEVVAALDAAVEARRALLVAQHGTFTPAAPGDLDIGAEVLVHHAYDEEFDGEFNAGWAANMNSWVGQVTVVQGRDEHNEVRLRLKNPPPSAVIRSYVFPGACLCRVPVAAPTPVVSMLEAADLGAIADLPT